MTTNELLRNKVVQIKTLEAKLGIDISIIKILSNRNAYNPNGICIHYKITSIADTCNRFCIKFVVFNTENRIRAIESEEIMDFFNKVDGSVNKEYSTKVVFDLLTDITDVSKLLIYPC